MKDEQKERQIPVRYIGEGVRSVPGVGVFQTGTTIHLPAPKAAELAEDDDFVMVGSTRPASRVVFQIGHLDPLTRPPEQPIEPRSDEMEPWLDEEPESKDEEPDEETP